MTRKPFTAIKNENENTYHIECQLTVYHEKLGKHPDFLQPTGDAQTGFYTKYYLLIEDNITDSDEASQLAYDCNMCYGNYIAYAENTGDWSQFPYKDKPIIYYK